MFDTTCICSLVCVRANLYDLGIDFKSVCILPRPTQGYVEIRALDLRVFDVLISYVKFGHDRFMYETGCFDETCCFYEACG